MRKIALSRSRAVIAGSLALFTGAAIALLPAGNADAAGLLPTSTALTASPATSIVGTSVTLTATVNVLGLNGVGVTPTGPVVFTSKNLLGASAELGTVSLSSCVLTPCTATLTTSAIPVGTVTVTAAYQGDTLTAPSSGSTSEQVNPNPNPGTSSTVTCYSGQVCDTGTVTSSDNTTKLDVKSSASSSTQTVHGDLSTGTLHCAPAGNEAPDKDGDDDDGVFVGALATFSSTAADSTKTITYTGQGMTTGSTGYIMYHQYSEHTAYAGCYGQDTPFKGYTHGVYGNAPFNATDGLYVAQLSNCAKNGGAKPCFTNSKTSTSDSYIIQTQAGDPKNVG